MFLQLQNYFVNSIVSPLRRARSNDMVHPMLSKTGSARHNLKHIKSYFMQARVSRSLFLPALKALTNRLQVDCVLATLYVLYT